MLETIAKKLLSYIYLFLAFVLTITMFDPAVIKQARIAGSFAYNYGYLINAIEAIGGLFTAPLEQLFAFFHWVDTSSILPEGANGWFPLMTASELSQMASKSGLDFLPPDLYDGAINWWLVLSAIVIQVASTLLAWFYPSIRNVIWNVFVEYVFHGKQVKRYEAALEDANQKVAELNNQNRFLSKETSVLKDTVITDELTKVFNRRFFLERIRLEYRQSKQRKGILSLIMVDIDYFKRLNDTYGHLAGDDVLRRVAAILKNTSPMNTYPCRYGGEEFAIILPGYTAEMAESVAEKIAQACRTERYPEIDPSLCVTLSQGICAVNFDCREAQEFEKAEEILEQADQMLYKSKMNGRDRVSVKTYN
jgi:diguanylate cyclase (GGDEF)-like protein